jgi:hypothetical protein
MQNFCFHFTGSWGGENGNVCVSVDISTSMSSYSNMQTWQPNYKEAFLNPVIINTIQSAYFGNPRATGFQYVNQFSSSVLSKPNEKELPH